MKILITGSSGYIGSVACKVAKEHGHFVYAVDQKIPATKKYHDVSLVENIRNTTVAQTAVDINVDAVFHFAASADVTDSTVRPSLYYWNNVGSTSLLLDNLTLLEWNNKFIFSSTAAVYGISNTPNKENENINPPNVYGKSKWMCEQLLHDIHTIHNIPVTIFRYFNVAGAYGDVGDHLNSGHVLQRLCDSSINNRPFKVFGHDLNTKDGSCVRDYLHVLDVVNAHLHSLDNSGFNTYNLGTSTGVSVLELVDKFKNITGKNIQYELSAPRPGDPTHLVADSNLFIEQTNFKYEHSDIDNIISSAYEWYRSNHAF